MNEGIRMAGLEKMIEGMSVLFKQNVHAGKSCENGLLVWRIGVGAEWWVEVAKWKRLAGDVCEGVDCGETERDPQDAMSGHNVAVDREVSDEWDSGG